MSTANRLPRALSSSFSSLPRRPTTTTHTPSTPRAARFSTTPLRGADIIRRPRRPYTFTQLVQLSDGSTYTMRTASPLGLYKSTKDTRNHVLWQPNEKSLRNVEVDEAGKLAAFRGRFGRMWDAATADDHDAGSSTSTGSGGGDDAAAAAAKTEGGGGGGRAEGKKSESAERAGNAGSGSGDAFADLIARYSVGQDQNMPGKVARKKK